MAGFILAQPDGTDVGRVVERPLAAGQNFNVGALLLVDANGAFAECGADPAAIAAVSESGAGTDASGFNRFGAKSFPPGYVQGTTVRGRIFRARYTGALPAADGGSYGVVRLADGDWAVDFGDTTATRVKLVGRLTNSPENQPQVLVRVLDANVQDI